MEEVTDSHQESQGRNHTFKRKLRFPEFVKSKHVWTTTLNQTPGE